jgi:hypothetical protein
MCVFSLIQPASKAHSPYHIVISGLSGSTVFPHIISQTHDFRKKKLFNMERVLLFSLQLLSKTFPILTRIQRGIIINVHRSSIEVPVYFVILNKTYIFTRDFENTQISNFMKIHPVRAEFHGDGRTDAQTRMKTVRNSRFSEFCESA